MSSSGIPTYAEDEIRSRLASELPTWSYEGGWLRRDVATTSRTGTLMLANRLAFVAEAAHHHPDLDVGAAGLRIRIRHHWAAGVTESDFELARALEDVLEERAAAAESHGA